MEDWRTKALECFPELHGLIEEQTAPMGLWIELYIKLVSAYDQQPIDEERIGKIYDYASWCFKQPGTADPKTDPSSAVAVGFIEDIPMDHRISDDLHRWMSAETFDGCENLFRYTLSDSEFERFAANFHSKKRNFNGPSRL
jgi:hypothetical protein